MTARNVRHIAAGLASLLLLTIGTAATGDSLTCEATTITFEPENRVLATDTCQHLATSKQLMAQCGLVQHQPLTIEIADTVEHPAFGKCLGYYDARKNCLKVTSPQSYIALLAKGDARADLPPEIVFASIIAHEVTHALLLQSPAAGQLGAAEHEFTASVFEMAAIPARWRSALLEADPVPSGPNPSLVHPGVYMLAPRVFTNNAWLMFQQPENGCDLIRRIADGTFQFPRD